MPDQIFISYRRDDAAYVTGHINDLLRKEFGEASVFTDVDNIALGVDFRAVLDESVSQCQVFLAVIGSGWLAAKDQDGKPRLADPADFVRIEIESALKRNIPVIPLLVAGASMPVAEELPESLRGLAFRNGTPIRPAPDFSADMARLVKYLRRYFDTIRKEKPGIAAGDVPSTVEQSNKQPLSTEFESSRSARSSTSNVDMRVADDEKARKRAELGIERRKSAGRSGAGVWLTAMVILAGGIWYFADRNPEAVEAVLGAFQSDSPGVNDDVSVNDPGDASGFGEEETRTAGDLSELANAADEETDAELDTDDVADNEQETIVAESATDEATMSIVDNSVAELPVVAESVEDIAADSAVVDESVDEVEAPAAENVTSAPAEDVEFEDTSPPESARQSDSARSVSEGVRLAGIGDHAAAIEIFGEAILRDTNSAFAYKQRAASYRALGQHEAAIKDYDATISFNAEDVNAYYNRAASHVALQDYVSAIADYDVVVQLDPEFVEAYSRRAQAHEANGDSEAAIRDRAVVTVFESKRNDRR